MTIVNEHHNRDKYNNIVFVEFCEYIARVAFDFYDLRYFDYEKEKLGIISETDDNLTSEEKRQRSKLIPPPNFKGERHIQVANFLDKLIGRYLR